MLNQQTMSRLYELKLTGMAEAFADQLNQPDMDKLSFAERFGLIVDHQWTWKENNRIEAQCLRRGYRLQNSTGNRSIRYDEPYLLRLGQTSPQHYHHRSYRDGKNLPCLCPDQQGLQGRIPCSLHPCSQVLISNDSSPGRWKLR